MTAAAPVAHRRWTWRTYAIAGAFLLPALVLLGALVVYPIVYTVLRSLQDRSGQEFVGLDNYRDMFKSSATLTAIRNNAIWVVFAPSIVTAVGLVLAVLAERIVWSTAFKFVLFMPMAISLLAAGVIFRVVYEADRDVGLANASIGGIVDVFKPPGDFPGARTADPQTLVARGKGFATTGTFEPGATVALPLVAINPNLVPDDAKQAIAPKPVADGLSGIVWLDFARGGGGQRGVIDPREVGLSGIRIQAVRNGDVVESATTDATGRFVFDDLERGTYQVRLTDSAFREPWGGFEWLGPTLVTPSIIGAYVWIWAGFALVVIAAGLASIPRDTLEAARMDGANEWQVFRRITAPLLAPVLLVVLVTLIINVLKIFDLILVVPPPSSQDNANVLALEMWRVSFGGGRDQGLGSALAVFLFLLVIPAMAFNVRRFRTDNNQ